jgi:cytochrome c oxidase subunit 1
MKHIFHLPAVLLPASIFFLQFFIGNSAVDIHIHDTLFVVPFWFCLLPVYLIIFLSFITHIVLRRKNLLTLKWAWFQVGVAILPILLYWFITLFNFFGTPLPRRYYSYSPWYQWNYHRYIGIIFLVICLVAFLTQIVLWIYAVIVLPKSRRTVPANFGNTL